MPYIHQQDYGLPSDAANRITNPLPGSVIGNEIIVHDNTVTVELFKALSNFYEGNLTMTAKALLLVLEVRDSTKPTIKS
jgi:hypothetical protein